MLLLTCSWNPLWAGVLARIAALDRCGSSLAVIHLPLFIRPGDSYLQARKARASENASAGGALVNTRLASG